MQMCQSHDYPEMNFHCLRTGHNPTTPRSSGPVECVHTKKQEDQARIQRERAAQEASHKRAHIMMSFRQPAALTHIDFQMNFGSRHQIPAHSSGSRPRGTASGPIVLICNQLKTSEEEEPEFVSQPITGQDP